MNPETLIADAAEQMKLATEQGVLRAHVCYFDGKLQVLQRQHTAEPHTIFFLLNSDQLTNGLTNAEWSILRTRLWNFFKEKI